MKQISILFILILLSISTAFSQSEYKPERFIKHDSSVVSVFTGYGYMNSGGISGYYNDLVNLYNNPAAKRTSHSNFGSTLVLGGQFLWTRVAPPIWIGASLDYSYTPASSKYNDDNSSSDIDGKISSLHVYFSSRYALENFSAGQLFLSIKPGMGYYSMNIKETSTYSSSAQTIRQTSLSLWVPSFQASLGFVIPFSKYFISYEAGYMVNVLGAQDLNVSSSSGSSSQVYIKGLNQAGPVSVLSFGFGL